MVFSNNFFSTLLSAIMSIMSGMFPLFSVPPANASEIAAKLRVLRELGIAFSEESGAYIEESIEKTKSMLADVGFDVSGFDSYPIILSMLGMGKYDEAAQRFIPLTDSVYAFDAECFDIVGAYGDFLLAVSRISNGEISVDEYHSDVSEATWEAGTGTQQVTFRLNGKPYGFEAQFHYDWMDCTVIDYVNGILEAEGIDKRLWCMFDGGQGLVVFFDTADWAQEFSVRTGCPLSLTASGAAV